jgi:amidase
VSNSSTVHVGARAGYPSVIVPAGYLRAGRKPAGLQFLGTAWSEATLLALAYDFEQASAAWRSPWEINPSLFR